MCEDVIATGVRPRWAEAEARSRVQLEVLSSRTLTASVNHPVLVFPCGDTICANTGDLFITISGNASSRGDGMNT